MHMFVPSDRSQVLFNVDAHVGVSCTNKAEDVLLVQFLMRKAAVRSLQDRPAIRQRLLRVPISGTCDDPTIDGIRAVQERMRERNPGSVIDGRVSPAKASDYGAGAWTIVTLNYTVRSDFPETWPRLHDFSDCPGLLKTRIPAIL